MGGRPHSPAARAAVAKLTYDLGTREPNFFETLGVRVDATPTEIKKAYKAVSLRYHPDKSDDPDAHVKFVRVSSAYEVLKDKAQRDAYNRFGTSGARAEETGSLATIALFYVIWCEADTCRRRTLAASPRAPSRSPGWSWGTCSPSARAPKTRERGPSPGSSCWPSSSTRRA